jgi:hypothetical protein
MRFIFPLCFLDVINVTRHFTMWLFKLCNNLLFERSAMIYISLCRQLDLGIDE